MFFLSLVVGRRQRSALLVCYYSLAAHGRVSNVIDSMATEKVRWLPSTQSNPTVSNRWYDMLLQLLLLFLMFSMLVNG